MKQPKTKTKSVIESGRIPLILLLDDEKQMRDLTRAALKNKIGATFLEADNGDKAIELLREHSVDLLITDMSHPGADGFMVIRKVRQLEHLRNTKVLLLTGRSQSQHPSASENSDYPDACLTKPFDTADLLICVRRLLTSSALSGADAMSKKRILVVNDEKEIVDLIVELLKPEGYLIRCAYDGAECLDALKKEIPDLLLLNGQMPVFSGLDVLRRMADHPKWRKIPVLMISAWYVGPGFKSPIFHECNRVAGSMQLEWLPGGGIFDPIELLSTIRRMLAPNARKLHMQSLSSERPKDNTPKYHVPRSTKETVHRPPSPPLLVEQIRCIDIDLPHLRKQLLKESPVDVLLLKNLNVKVSELDAVTDFEFARAMNELLVGNLLIETINPADPRLQPESATALHQAKKKKFKKGKAGTQALQSLNRTILSELYLKAPSSSIKKEERCRVIATDMAECQSAVGFDPAVTLMQACSPKTVAGAIDAHVLGNKSGLESNFIENISLPLVWSLVCLFVLFKLSGPIQSIPTLGQAIKDRYEDIINPIAIQGIPIEVEHEISEDGSDRLVMTVLADGARRHVKMNHSFVAAMDRPMTFYRRTGTEGLRESPLTWRKYISWIISEIGGAIFLFCFWLVILLGLLFWGLSFIFDRFKSLLGYGGSPKRV